jgi:alpha-D-ribose 1-methylphosphonate 5-triphosphate diphosphatase
MNGTVAIENGEVVTSTGVISDGTVVVRDGTIEEIYRPSSPVGPECRSIDAGGNIVMPGIVDLHGDDVEQHLFPRSNAVVDTRVAVSTADRANLTSGVTTKFHAIAFEETPEQNRSLDCAREIADTIESADELLIDNRIHARCELSADSVEVVSDLLERSSVELVSLMHHAPEHGQFADRGEFVDLYVSERGCTTQEAEKLLEARSETAVGTLRDRCERIVRTAHNTETVVASHDDTSKRSVERMSELGVDIVEYPVTMTAAAHARELGFTTAMGAPNMTRGRSLYGNLSAKRAARADVLDVLCADYHPPSLLSAAFVDTGESLSERVARVTRNPADAVGLTDRGRIEKGARADLLVVDPEPVPTVECVLLEGSKPFQTSGASG